MDLELTLASKSEKDVPAKERTSPPELWPVDRLGGGICGSLAPSGTGRVTQSNLAAKPTSTNLRAYQPSPLSAAYGR